jgi:uracil-DNA glycosylase
MPAQAQLPLPKDLSRGWKTWLEHEKKQSYFKSMEATLRDAAEKGQVIYPPAQQRFRALSLTPYHAVRVVILGQDPYPNPGQAHGLSFSVPEGMPIPPSLRNIFKALQHDTRMPSIPTSGDLQAWAKQGVLLLNQALTVPAKQAHGHANIGWKHFTASIMKRLNAHPDPLVFMLWGKAAEAQRLHLSNPKHLVLTAPHPSPLSAYRGFLHCGHFAQANRWLKEKGRDPIHWDCVCAQ